MAAAVGKSFGRRLDCREWSMREKYHGSGEEWKKKNVQKTEARSDTKWKWKNHHHNSKAVRKRFSIFPQCTFRLDGFLPSSPLMAAAAAE